MHIPQQIALKLDVLLDPNVEKAIQELLDSQKSHVHTELGNTSLPFDQIRCLQGQLWMLNRLSNYKNYLKDSLAGRK